MDSDQARQHVGPDLDPNFLTLQEMLEKCDLKHSADDKNIEKFPRMQRVKCNFANGEVRDKVAIHQKSVRFAKMAYDRDKNEPLYRIFN